MYRQKRFNKEDKYLIVNMLDDTNLCTERTLFLALKAIGILNKHEETNGRNPKTYRFELQGGA